MSEASGGGERAERVRRLIDRSEDGDFRQRLLDDPMGTLEQELGDRLPEGVEVRAVEGERKDHLCGASQRLAGRRRRRALRSGAGGGSRRRLHWEAGGPGGPWGSYVYAGWAGRHRVP